VREDTADPTMKHPASQPGRWAAEQFGVVRAARHLIRLIADASHPKLAYRVGITPEEAEAIREACNEVTAACSALMDQLEYIMFDRGGSE
jgi:hypothetical protein